MAHDIPKCFGFPLWRGKIKKRIAKKYINRYHRDVKRMKEFANYKVGDLVNDCSGFNVRITELRPEYWSGYGGEILMNVNIYSVRNSASWAHCGIEHPKSYEELKKYIEESQKMWGEKDEYGFAKKNGEGILHPDGTFSVKE